MTAGAMSDGSPVSPELDARLLADLREWRARLAPTNLGGNRWSARLTIDELDMLLRVAAERDALKAAAMAEWEADIPAEIRARAAATPAVEGCPRRGTIHDCPLGGCPTPVRHVNAPRSVEPVLGREARETPPAYPREWTDARIREAFIDDGGQAEYHDPINGARDQRRFAGAIFDAWISTHDDGVLESDERIQAWNEIAAHPFFASCYDAETTLLAAMLAKLANVAEPTPVYQWRATGCAWGGDRMGAEAAMRHYARMHGGRLERRVAAGPWTVTS